MVDLIVTVLTIVVVLAAAAIVFVALNRLVDLASIEWQDRIRPWVFILPALVFLGVGLVWPTVRTVYLSFRGGPRRRERLHVRQLHRRLHRRPLLQLQQLGQHLHEPPVLPGGAALFAAVAYVVVGKAKTARRASSTPRRCRRSPSSQPPCCCCWRSSRRSRGRSGTTSGGWSRWPACRRCSASMLAILADRCQRREDRQVADLHARRDLVRRRGGHLALRLLPQHVARGHRPAQQRPHRHGLLDEPIDFYTSASIIPWNNFFLMIIMIWIQIGFALVVLSAAVKAVPTEHPGGGADRRRVRAPVDLAGGDPAGVADRRRRADDAHGHGHEGLRPREGHDQRPQPDGRAGQLDVREPARLELHRQRHVRR